MEQVSTGADQRRAEVWARVERIREQVIGIRRDLHAHPELAFQEKRTAAVVEGVLRDLGIEVRTGVGRTGVIGLLRGARPGRTIALRADMDALPMDDQLEAPYASTVRGVAHKCGHDAHTAMLLGTAMVLSGLRDRLSGNVKFLFEPAEEIVQSKCEEGAELMVAEGALEDPPVDAVIGCHVFPELPTGHVAVRAGVIMTGMDLIDITVIGRETHTATPEKGVDAIVVAGQVLGALQALTSRETSPTESLVIHIGTIHGGQARNILADRVEMTGSVRTSSLALRPLLRERVERVVRGVAESMRASYELKWTSNYLPAVVNDPAIARLVADAGREVLGEDRVEWLSLPRPAGESFYHYSNRVPGAFWFLGSGNPMLGTDLPSHHPRFDVDEEALPAGVAVFCSCCLTYLA